MLKMVCRLEPNKLYWHIRYTQVKANDSQLIYSKFNVYLLSLIHDDISWYKTIFIIRIYVGLQITSKAAEAAACLGLCQLKRK